jgi:hypothetical protein
MIYIRSCSSNRELKISQASDSYLMAEFTGFPVSAKLKSGSKPATLPDFKRSLPTLASKFGPGVVRRSGSRLKVISGSPRPVLYLAMSSLMSRRMACQAQPKTGP